MIFQNSRGFWVLHDGAAYRYFESEQEAKMAEITTALAEQPAEYEIAATVIGDVLPQLRQALLALQALKMAWYANGIPEMIEAAMAAQAEIDAATEEKPTTLTEADTLIAGLPVQNWAAWGAVFAGLEEWLNAPLAGLNVPPTAVLAKRYTRKG